MSAYTPCADECRTTRPHLHRQTPRGQSDVRDEIWKYHRALKAYRRRPTKRSKAVLLARFERISTLKIGFVTLDRLLGRLHKKELLMVLDHPEIPLDTDGSENDVPVGSRGAKSAGAPAVTPVAIAVIAPRLDKNLL